MNERLAELTISELVEAFARRAVTCRDVVEAHLQRIDDVDRRGPCLQALIEVNPDALSIAERLDRERHDGTVRGPLHGVPMLLKDNLVTADRMSTTAASHLLHGMRYARDADVVARLRSAGAVILGKANMDELGAGAGEASGRGGPVRNPHDLTRSASGSSSGVAAGVAAGLAVAGIGTETECSLRFPAAACGVVALKPSPRVVSADGVVPLTPGLDIPGPIARTVGDVALLLDAIRRDGARPAALEGVHLAGRRLGVVRGLCGGRTDDLVERGLERLRKLGAVLVDVAIAPIPSWPTSPLDQMALAIHQVKALIGGLAATEPGSYVTSIEQLLHLLAVARVPSSKLDLVEAMVAELAETGALESAPHLGDDVGFDALRRYTEECAAPFTRVFDDHRLDALIHPTMLHLPPPIVGGDDVWEPSRGLSSRAGMPELTLPLGLAGDGLPVGISLVGRALGEVSLLELAGAVEGAIGTRPTPTLPERLPPLRARPVVVPANATFARRTLLRAREGAVRGSVGLARIESGEPRHGRADRSVWFSWTATDASSTTFTLAAGDRRHHVVAYAGDALDELRVVATTQTPESERPAATLPSPPQARALVLGGVAGATYQLAVVATRDASRGFEFELSWRPSEVESAVPAAQP